MSRAAGTQPRPGAIGIGSVKTNMGHLEGAAGVAGMVKVLAALRHGQLPANVGFQQLNRLIDLSGSDFRIQAEATPWPPTPGAPRRAGVSSFGFGGSNGHVVIEEAPQVPPAKPGRGAVVLPFSARDDGRLRALAGLLGLLTRDPQVFLQATPRNEGEISAADIEALIGQRVAAKHRKDYAAADRIRSELATAGVILEDGAKGTGWRRA